jgi:tetratricopeptide (TPR) repeat protein
MKTSAQELFLQANQWYEKKEYQKAAEFYEKIPKKSAAVWYNLGNCAYKNGNDLQALLYWQRAQKLGDSKTRNQSSYNISVITKKLSIPESNNIVQKLPPLPLQILFFCTFGVFLVINRKLWLAKRFAMLLGMGLLVIGTGALTFAVYRVHTTAHGLIMHDESILYAGPDVHYHEIVQIPKGNQVIVKNKKNGWIKVSWSGQTGWMENSNIELI